MNRTNLTNSSTEKPKCFNKQMHHGCPSTSSSPVDPVCAPCTASCAHCTGLLRGGLPLGPRPSTGRDQSLYASVLERNRPGHPPLRKHCYPKTGGCHGRTRSLPKKHESKMFGGAVVLNANAEQSVMRIGERNIETARLVLKELSIPIVSECVGGDSGFKLIYETYSGKVLLRRIQPSQTPPSFSKNKKGNTPC